MMDYHVMEAEYVSGFIVRLRFGDGTVGEIDLKPELYGPVFEPLKNLKLFRQLRVDPEFHTLVWPNGADFAPEFLHEHVRRIKTSGKKTVIRPKRAKQVAERDAVILEPDVAAEFTTAEEVNYTLRAVADILRRSRKRSDRKTA